MAKKGKKPKVKVIYITVTIQDVKKKQVVEEKEKVLKDGVVEIRTHTKKTSWTSEDVKYNWKTTGYKIPLMKLGLTKEASKSEIMDKLNTPSKIVNKTIADLAKKFVNSYGGVKGGGKSKYEFKTVRFAKKKDYGPKKKVMMS
ncbi:MAG: hypothetical protein ACTSUE_02755 [Promethearchaeota archaeon]